MTPNEATIYYMTMDSLLLWMVGVNAIDQFLTWNYAAMWWDDSGEYVVLDIDK